MHCYIEFIFNLIPIDKFSIFRRDKSFPLRFDLAFLYCLLRTNLKGILLPYDSIFRFNFIVGLQQLLTIIFNKMEVDIEKGKKLLIEKKYQEAHEWFDNLIKAHPDSPLSFRLFSARGVGSYGLGKFKDADVDFD